MGIQPMLQSSCHRTYLEILQDLVLRKARQKDAQDFYRDFNRLTAMFTKVCKRLPFSFQSFAVSWKNFSQQTTSTSHLFTVHAFFCVFSTQKKQKDLSNFLLSGVGYTA
jgi:hypothetical protein